MQKDVCPGCGRELESDYPSLDASYNASLACRALYDELSAFTLSVGDNGFIHQLVVDSYAAQHSGIKVKPISTVFALIGLFLTFERGYLGREVQQAHMVLAKTRRTWPFFRPPAARNSLTVRDVLQGLTPENYPQRIKAWGKSVWMRWQPEHENIRKLVKMYLAN